MKVLVTGGLGNIGSAVVRTLLEDGVSVRVFEQATRPNLRKAADAAERVAKAAARAAVSAAKAAVGEARRLGKAVGLKGRANSNGQAAEAAAATFREHARRLRGLEVTWGDLGDGTGLQEAVEGCDAVVHMAFIIPPTSERRTEWARNINVGGTRRLLDACLAGGRNPRVVFASSISVYGNSQGKTPPRRVGDEVDPIDAYGKMKIECEDMLKESGLPWTILRVAAAPTIDWQRIDPIMFDIPLTDRIEFVHPEDAGYAFAKAAQLPETAGRTMQIGGGVRCQMTQYEFMRKALTMLGVRMLPREAFGLKNYHTDWMDTEESQALLHYQRKDFDTFLREQGVRYGARKALVVLARPIARAVLLSKSPYYKEYHRGLRNQKTRMTPL
jgi:nucleoside-diphosphate-sugar epimerase